MKLIKNSIFMFMLGIIVSGTIAFAVTSMNASEIKYTDKNSNETTVDKALDDLYSKANKKAVQVATLTTQGATYAMQNDGYITGTASTPDNWDANVTFDGKTISVCPGDTASTFNVSLYVTKGTVVTTRSDHGVYNLTIYEWK